MTRPNRNGFTLVELLVVITIISMLVGLLIPAVQMARTRALQTQCMNNQHELAIAVLGYESAKGHLPGYTNRFGSIQNLSWLLVVMPHLGKNDIWEVARKSTASVGDYPDRLPQLVCPSDDQASERFALSYVANCGQYVPDASDATANKKPPVNGLFVNRNSASAKSVTTSGIRDGAANTILFGENIQASQWLPLNTSGVRRGPYVIDVGFMWTDPIGPQTAAAPLTAASVAPINVGVDDAPAFPYGATTETDDPVLIYRRYARPSSPHAGVVVVTYADGHQDSLDYNIQDDVYLKLVNPAE